MPWGSAALYAWHRARYEFAAPLVAGKDVLDVGSGEGYGAALLAETAASVVGIDYSPAAVEHARGRYVRPNLGFEVVDVTRDPLGGRFDVITCFEVIEHVRDHDSLICRLGSALRAGGTLVMSTPNILVSGVPQDDGAYHVHCVRPAELRRALRAHFSHVRLLGQIASDRRTRELVKSLDPLHLRRRLRSTAVGAVARSAVKPSRDDAVPAPSFIFTRFPPLVRQAPHTVAVATR